MLYRSIPFKPYYSIPMFVFFISMMRRISLKISIIIGMYAIIIPNAIVLFLNAFVTERKTDDWRDRGEKP